MNEKKSAITVLVSVISTGSTFIAIPILLSHFGPAGFGALSKLSVLLALLPIFDLGLSQSIIQMGSRFARFKTNSSDVIIYQSITALLQTIVFFLLISILSIDFSSWTIQLKDSINDYLGIDKSAVLVIVILLVRMLIPTVSTQEYIRQETNFINTLTMISNVSRSLGLAAMAVLRDLSLSEYLALYLIISGAELLVYVSRIKLPRVKKSPFDESIDLSLKQFIINGGKIWILVVLWNGVIQADRLFLSVYTSPDGFGYIWAQISLAFAPFLISGALNAFYLPFLASLNNTSIRREFEKTIRIYMMIVLAPNIFLFCFFETICTLWLGPSELNLDFAQFTRLYLVGNFFAILSSFSYFIRFRNGIEKRFVLYSSVFGLVNVFGFWILARQYGPLGTALAWTVCSALFFFVIARPYLTLHTDWTLRIESRLLSEILAAFIFFEFLKFGVSDLIIDPIFQLVAASVVTALAWVIFFRRELNGIFKVSIY